MPSWPLEVRRGRGVDGGIEVGVEIEILRELRERRTRKQREKRKKKRRLGSVVERVGGDWERLTQCVVSGFAAS